MHDDLVSIVPSHVAIIMDGNGRWASMRGMDRTAGHKKGADVLHEIVKHSSSLGIKYLTVFAFSSENWQRPKSEVKFLFDLLWGRLTNEVDELKKNNVCLRVIGDKTKLNPILRNAINNAEKLTKDCDGIFLNVAINYGGRWDIAQAVEKCIKANKDHSEFTKFLSLADFPEPDLLIRTGGEQRISNFLLWDIAYTELYFSDVFWPDFKTEDFDLAINSFSKRIRKFGGVPVPHVALG